MGCSSSEIVIFAGGRPAQSPRIGIVSILMAGGYESALYVQYGRGGMVD